MPYSERIYFRPHVEIRTQLANYPSLAVNTLEIFAKTGQNRTKNMIVQYVHRLFLYCTLRARDYQPTAYLTSSCPRQRSSGQLRGDMWSVRQMPSRYWLSKPGLSLQISSYANSTRRWFDTSSPYLSVGTLTLWTIYRKNYFYFCNYYNYYSV